MEMGRMNIAVLKFGGTSISTPEGRRWAFKHIREHLANNLDVVVVASAMGRTGDPYSTDTLLSLLETVKVPSRDVDLLMSCGEIISTVVLSSYLTANGVTAFPMTGSQAGILTSDNHGKGSIVNLDGRRIVEVLSEGKTPVVAGFQGRAITGEVTTLGRGGSDITAIALAAALGAKRVEIFKDVPGVMTGDPKVDPDARLLDRMSAGKLLLMAQTGARVIHHKAVSLAMENRVTFHVRSNFTNEPGTIVYPAEEKFVSPS